MIADDMMSYIKNDIVVFGIGVLCIVLGYILMYLGNTASILSTKISPIILIVGYCVLIPISILKKF